MSRSTLYIDEELKKSFKKSIENTRISEDGYGLALYRILFGSFMLYFSKTSWTWICEFSDAFHNPNLFNIIGWLGYFPGTNLIGLLQGIYILSLGAITIGIRARYFSLTAFFCLIVLNGIEYSFGKVDHYILLSVLFLALASTNAGCKLALLPDKKLNTRFTSKALAYFAIAICVGMFCSGFPKALSWIDFDFNTSGILRWYYGGYYSINRTELLAPYFMMVPHFIVEVLDHIVPIFEISGIYFLLKSRRFWKLWLALFGFFHLSTSLILNIAFIEHILVYSLFILPELINSFKKNLFFIRLFQIMLCTVSCLKVVILLIGYTDKPIFSLFHLNNSLRFSVALWIAYLSFCLFYFIRTSNILKSTIMQKTTS